MAVEIALVCAQLVLVAVFGRAGFFHSARFAGFARDPRYHWAGAVGRLRMRVIGVAEIAAAAGLAVSISVGIAAPSLVIFGGWLAVASALGLTLLSAAAVGFHVARGEIDATIAPSLLAVLAGSVVAGRIAAGSL